MSAPARAATRIGAQSRFELVTLLANGEQLLVSLVLPVLALLGSPTAPCPRWASGAGSTWPSPECSACA